METHPMLQIATERRFYDWIVDYMHEHGDVYHYPKSLVEAAELAIAVIDNDADEEELLPELFPGAHISEVVIQRNQALGLAFHLALNQERRPYSSDIIQFLAECFRPPGISGVEEAARIGFAVSGLHRTGFFREYRGKRLLHLVTTDRGIEELGISVHLEYEPDDPFFRSDISTTQRMKEKPRRASKRSSPR
jgi:hypothetical protein